MDTPQTRDATAPSAATTPKRRSTERGLEPLHLLFDATPEIFATDGGGAFYLPLLVKGEGRVDTRPYDEVRLMISVWHPSNRRNIDLDRAYVELRARIDPEEDHWIKLAEVEPVVPAYAGGESFDGWIVLPVMAQSMAFSLFGSGFDTRARVQARVSAYFVA